MGFLNWKKDGIKKWHVKARLIDPHKTRITLNITDNPKRVPPWVYKSFSPKGIEKQNHES